MVDAEADTTAIALFTLIGYPSACALWASLWVERRFHIEDYGIKDVLAELMSASRGVSRQRPRPSVHVEMVGWR